MAGLRNDLRDTWRRLRRDRLYAAAVIGTLSLTLGASTAVFAIVHGVLLRPLDYPHPQALVSLREILPSATGRYPSLPVTMRHFEIWRERATSFSSMAAMDWRTSTLTGAGEAAQVVLLRTSGTLFDVLGISPARGRALTRDDEQPDRPRVVVISDWLWRERLGADPDVLGRPLTLNGTEYTIVGVLPRGCALPRLETLGESGTVTRETVAVVPFRITLANFDWMGQFNYSVVARLKPGVTVAQARAEMQVLQAAVAEIASRETKEPAELRGWLMPLEETIAGPSRRGLLLLLAAIGALLLIACANLANLTLTRALGGLRDAAVRTALGSSRLQLARGILVEQLALGAAGCALGLAFAGVVLRVFVITAPVALPRAQDVEISLPVVLFATGVAVLAALVVALLPAWRIGRGDLESVLRGGGRSSDAGTARVRGTLLAAQVALSVTLLAMSGLLLSSLGRLLNVDTGLATEGAMTVEVAPASARYPDIAARAALYDRIFERVRTLPGVTAAAWTSALPLTGETWVDQIIRPDVPETEIPHQSANYRFVGPEYFRAVGTPLLRGRAFAPRDRDSAITPAVISARTAQTMWPGEEAIGRQFSRSDPAQRFEIVGVVPDGRVTALESESPLMVYVPYWFNNEGESVLVVRAAGDPLQLAPAIRSIVREVDPDVAVAGIAPMRELVDAAVEGRRYQTGLLGVFAGAALLIAMLGVHATTAYAVTRRQRELNIRAALGAQPSQIFSMVLRQSTVPVAFGLACGLAGALASAGAIRSLLYDVRPQDPVVLGSVIALVAVVATLAAAVATLTGLRLEPAAALRQE